MTRPHKSEERLRTTVVSGFLGSGKTTLLERLLNNARGRAIAVIVNDARDSSNDSRLLHGKRLRHHPNVTELTNGCVCCTLRDELSESVARIHASGQFDYLVIEATGISEPLPIATVFFSDDDSESSLEGLLEIDSMVTVVDAHNFPFDFESRDTLRDRRIALDDNDDRSVSDVLAEQVEFANTLVINKTDLVSDVELRRLEAILHQLNPEARLVQATHGLAPSESIIDTRTFDFEKVSQASGWQQAIIGKRPPAASEFGLGNFVYRARRPFHPGRLWDALQAPLPGVIRVKGFFWLASRHNHAGVWSQAGRAVRDDLAGRWWASLPREEWPEESRAQEEIHRLHQEPYGDRRQELVFIGVGLNESLIQARLDECLLDDVEMALGQLGWEAFADPFSAWWDDEEGEIAGSANVPTA